MTFSPSDPNEPSHAEPYPPTEPRLATREPFDDPHREHPRPALFAASLHHRAHHHLRRILLTVGTLTALIAFVLILTTAWLRHAMRASLPQLDGALHAPGLTLPVTVTRDAQGVPSIQASNLDDLLFAQGFITAQDRLWQMDTLRRHASGQLAEILGASMIEHDRLQRTLQVSEAADRAIAALPADQLHQLQAYARGINAFIAQNSGHLPVEFHLLHYTPAPWTPRDTLLVSLAMFQDLSTQFPVKLRREALATHLPTALLADLYPVGSWRDHPPTQPPPDLTTPVPEVEQIPLDRTQSQTTTPAELLNLSNQFPSLRCPECRAGSNNWTVAASHSASGAPLVSNDMHLALNVPSIWYEAGLHATATNTTPELNVTGFTLPGVPFVIVGRNQHVAWGFTNLGADVQDVRIEHLRGSGANLEFQRADGTWQPVTHHREHIVVRFGHDFDIDVLTTTEQLGAPTISTRAAGVTQIETPIITPLLPGEKRALSLAWTAYDPTTLVLPHLAVDTAPDGAAIVAALATFGGPSLNLIYADDHNHIGYHALGAIPIRGPATQHLRTLTAPLPTGSEPADEEDQLNDSDESNEAPTAQQPPPTALPSSKPTFDYTIGSPISPIPVDALDASQTWSGYIPFAQLPAIVDPPNGVLATANSRVQPDDYPYALALNWEPPYRTERINKLLVGRTGLTPADMLALQNDVHSEFDLVLAQRLAYALDHAKLPGDTKRLHQAADILRAWNGEVTPNAVAPSIIAAVRTNLWPVLLIPQIDAHDQRKHRTSDSVALATLYDWDEQSVALETLLQHTPKRWLPPGFANWDDLLINVVERGLRGAHAPADLSTWHFGSLYPVEINHPVFSAFPLFDHLLGTPTGTGPRITGGDGTTVKTIALHHGPSERFTADLSNPQITWGNITTGQSGNPTSPNYLDQFLPWLNGTTFPLPLNATQQTHTLTLLP